MHSMLPFPLRKGFFLFRAVAARRGCLRLILILTAWVGLVLPLPAHANATPQRVISMSPSVTETLFALGVGDRVVGVTDFCQWPREACARTKVGGLLNPNLETWIALRPDLVILQDTSERLLKHARNLGIPTLVVDMSRLENIYQSFHHICQRLECESAATALVSQIQNGVEAFQKRLINAKRKRVLLLLGDSADPARDMYAVGPATFLGELIQLAGGENLLTDPIAPYPRISKEFVLHESPEVIIEAGPKVNFTPAETQSRMKEWGKFASVTAVKTKQIYFIGSDFILIPGPRLLDTLGKFAHAIHPEVFAKDNAL